MADILAASSGVAGLLSLGIKVVEGIIQYYTALKTLDAIVTKTIARLKSLLTILQQVDEAVRRFVDDDREIVAQIHGCIEDCEESIRELQSEYVKFKKQPSGDFKARTRVTKHRVLYPFRAITLQKLDAEISEIRANLSIAISVLGLKSQEIVRSGLSKAKLLLERIRSDQISVKIRNWLNAPDTYTEHSAAHAQQHPGTGTWFIQSDAYRKWLNDQNSLLWLNGFAGCGKTVLCSTLIEHTFEHNQGEEDIGVAFYYFTFREEQKRSEIAMLRALLLQLASQLVDGETILQHLHDQYQYAAPPNSTLIYHIRYMISKFRHVYIFIDAVDESPRFEQRDRVLAAIEEIQRKPIAGLHCLLTSRDEPDIRESVVSMQVSEVNLRNAQIDQDIAKFVSEKLRDDPRLKKWQKFQDRICKELAERAQGVFRWVECQLGELKRCLHSERHLDECLGSLPRTLDETYERILGAIPESCQKEARRLLVLLCFAGRPLSVDELLDAMAVSLEDPIGLDYRSRLGDEHDLQEICPGLIEFCPVDEQEANALGSGYSALFYLWHWMLDALEHPYRMSVRIAHFSVQDYLVSRRIEDSGAAYFAMKDCDAHEEIARICCTYIKEPGLKSSVERHTTSTDYPLAKFSARFWYHHYRHAVHARKKLQCQMLDVFQLLPDAFQSWVRLDGVEILTRCNEDRLSPLSVAAWLGLEHILHELMIAGSFRLGANTGSEMKAAYGDGLLGATNAGHHGIVEMLLRNGTDANCRGPRHGSPLCTAARFGHERITRTLLDHGANVNALGGHFGTALSTAATFGHEGIIRALLDGGANVNALGGHSGSALCAAIDTGHEGVVEVLLERGAEFNTRVQSEGYKATALERACTHGYQRIVRQLLDRGADLSLPEGPHRDALCLAIQDKHEYVATMLLEAGATVDPSSERSRSGTPLQLASIAGLVGLVQNLLTKGADVNAQSKNYGTALHAACARGHRKVAEMLLEAAAEVNALGGPFGTALASAARNDDELIIRALLSCGANVNAKATDRHRNAVQVASHRGHQNIVRILLDHGARQSDVDALKDINWNSDSDLDSDNGSDSDSYLDSDIDLDCESDSHGGSSEGVYPDDGNVLRL